MSGKQGAGIFLSTVVIACANASTVHAESGFFVGAHFGQANYDLDSSRSFLPAGVPLVSAEKDDSGSAVALNVGYRFGRYFGIEASYVDLGHADNKEIGRVSFPVVHEAPAEASLGVSGPAVTAFAFFPIGRFEPYVKAGVLFASTEFDFVYSEFISGYSLSESTSTTETHVGLGVAYWFKDQLAFKLEGARYLEVGDADTGEVDIDSLTAGFQFRF